MFQELMPLLAQRVIMVTATRINTDLICVNVIPQRLKSGDENNEALTTPLSLTGTPRELDEELPKQLVEFVHSHLGLSSTLKNAKEEMEAAAKAAREASRKSTATKARAATKESAPATENPGTASNVQASEAKSMAASDDTSDATGAGTGSFRTNVPTSGELFGHPSVENH
jgi:PRTRC genetic system protein E